MSSEKYTSKEYRAFRREYLKKLKARKIAAGICVRCPAPAKPGFRSCEKHLDFDRKSKHRNYDPIEKSIKNKKAYYKKVNSGQCTRCSEPARPGQTECEEHAQRNRIRSARNNKIQRKRYLEEGRCGRCGIPLDELEKREKKLTCVDCSSHLMTNKKHS